MSNILKERNIKFYIKDFDGVKMKSVDTEDWDMGFISALYDYLQLDEVISNLDLAIAGKYDEIDDPSIVNKYDEFAYIQPNKIEYWDENHNKYSFSCSLQDFRELCIEWRKFLRT